MNNPPAQPPLIPSSPPPLVLPPGSDPAEREPVSGPVAAVECLLRQPRRVLYQLREGPRGPLAGGMLAMATLFALVYGVVVGAFSGGPQLWAAPLKTAAGLWLSAAICLPSLYIFACLDGAKARLGEVAGMVTGVLLLMTLLLIGFAPVAWIFSQSTGSLAAMGALHLLFWLIATYFGLRFLSAGFAGGARGCGGLRVWMVIFILVMLQMMTALRPLIGTADTFLPTEKKFFLKHWGECLEQRPGSAPE